VYLLIPILTEFQVAVKVITKSKLDQKTLKMVEREVKIMKLLKHSHIIKLIEVIDVQAYLFIVMEWASGGEVMDFIGTHGRFKEDVARTIFRQVVSAIDYCHASRIIRM